ncbi:MAG: S41 family peptidase [Verrucomicrobiales bacterium]|nr:S41 family peptidase [Verrucomicrobiota bacterium JB025]
MKTPATWLALATLACAESAVPPDPDEAAYPAIERFVTVLESVRKRHPDADLLAYDRLVNHALEGMLASLDPHSSFIHPEMAAALDDNPELDTTIPSLGITFGLRDDGPYLMAVAPGSAADNQHIATGSSLIEIDGKPATSATFHDWLGALHRPAGALTTLTIKSPASPKLTTHTLTHRLIEERSVTDARLWNKHTGYLRLARFGNACAAEVEAALDELEDSGMTSLVLDLRGNPGGDLAETVRIIGLFTPPATNAVTIRTRGEGEETLTTPDRQRRKRSYPVAVLIDRDSASASELTAGALQDLKRATVIGETSYGKGSVQNIIPMGGGTALRLTIATYHTPSGKTPHRNGITPDLAVEIDDLTRTNYQDVRRIDTLPPDRRKELASWTDPILQTALESLTTQP